MAVNEIYPIAGGVCAAKGFAVAGVRCGIKRKRRDVALICGGEATTAAGVMTTNVMCAPSVTRNRQVLATSGGRVRAVVVNAGNANVGNGPQGDDDNAMMAHLAADALGISPSEVLTASTGIIGHFLPVDKIVVGIAECGRTLANTPEAASHAAEAILTTDTFPKEYAVQFKVGGVTAHIGGIAKGSGMIAPNMATMLSFLTTDLAVAPTVLDAALRKAVDVSFNCLTVDGDTSTSDQCLVLASGAAGNTLIADINSLEAELFISVITHVCIHLAKAVARDGEGATKLVTVRVTGAKDFAGAKQVAKTIAESPLVKTALFGNDPNWGRLLMAAGRAGVPFDPNKATASLAGVEVFRHGRPTPFDAAALSKKMASLTFVEISRRGTPVPAEAAARLRAEALQELEIHLDLGVGDASAVIYTCDFSYDYVEINAEYHT